MIEEVLETGEYEVEVHIRMRYAVSDEDEMTERDVVDYCRQHGEMVDWNVEEN